MNASKAAGFYPSPSTASAPTAMPGREASLPPRHSSQEGITAEEAVAVLISCGNAAFEAGVWRRAAECYQEAIKSQPGQANAWYNLGNTFKRLEEADQAIDCFRKAIQYDPHHAACRFNLANSLKQKLALNEAIDGYQAAIRIQPHFPAAHYNLGNTLALMDQWTQAIHHFQMALRQKPGWADVHNNLGLALSKQGRMDEALANFRQAIALRPEFNAGWSNLLYALSYDNRLPPRERARIYFQWGRTLTARTAAPPAAPRQSGRQKRPLRVGYVSPDFRTHSLRFFLEPLLRPERGTGLHVTCFAEVKRPDAWTQRFQDMADDWVDTVGLSDRDAAQSVQARGIDILVDLASHTADNRLGIFACRAAPVQATWLGYGYTSGLPDMDYFLSDSYLAPEAVSPWFCETIVRLPRLPYAFHVPDTLPVITAPPSSTGNGFTFGCFSRAEMLTRETTDLWSVILNDLPESRLVLACRSFRDPGTRQRFRHRFQKQGVAPGRLRITAFSNAAETIRAYRNIDIALDPFPHNGGITLLEAALMGVPFITLAGQFPNERFGGRLGALLGLVDWVAETPEAYRRIAIERANSPPSDIATLRTTLRQRLIQSEICDYKGFLVALEACYRGLLDRKRPAPSPLFQSTENTP